MDQPVPARFFEVAPANVALRIAQSTAVVRQSPMVLFGNGFGVLIGALAISPDYPTATIVPMVAGMWMLLLPVFLSWLRLRRRPRPQYVSVSRIYKLVWYSGALGVYWAGCMIYYLPAVRFDSVGFLVTGCAFLAIGSASAMYVIPMACLAFTVPMTLAGLYVTATCLHESAFPLFLLVLLMSAGTTWTLVANWKNFHTILNLSAEKERLLHEAEGVAREKAEFLDNVNHEIRTPLGGVIGFTEQLLRERDALSPVQQTVADNIQHSARLLLTMVNDLLDASRVAAHHYELHVSGFNVRDMLEDVLAVVSLDAQAKGLNVRLKVAPSVPQIVQGDAARLAQVMLNLMSNAIKFTSAGMVMARADYRHDGGQLHLSVTDTGMGIPPRELDRLFQRFSQLGQPAAVVAGAGLGLFICRKLVGIMGGRIEVESSVGKGCTFHVWLPAAAVDVAAVQMDGLIGMRRLKPSRNQKSAEDQAFPLPMSAQPVMHILAADDSPQNLLLLEMMLSGQGYEVLTASDGLQAVAACKLQRFDLILMDIDMGSMDGIAATLAIRASGGPSAATPIIAVTGYISAPKMTSLRQAGMNDCIHKPLSSKVLNAAVQKWITPLPLYTVDQARQRPADLS